MLDLNKWELFLLAGGAFWAVTSLVRLMRNRRDAILDQLREQAEVELRRKQIEEKREQRKKRHKELGGKVA